jgi:putative flippase GtrA
MGTPTPPPPPVKSASAAPVRKVAAGGIGGAISVIAIALLQHFANTQIDPTLASAITIVVSFLVAYIVPPAASDTPVPA